MLGTAPPVADRVHPVPEALAPVAGGLAAELRDVLAHLVRRRLGILAAAALMALVGLAVASAIPRLYTATAQLMVDPRGLRVFDNEVVPSGQLSDVQSTLVETQARILRSDSVLQPVVQAENLAEDPEFDGEPQSPLAAALQGLKALLPSSGPPDRAAIALANLTDATKVQHVAGSFVLELSVSAKDAQKAARLAHAIVETYIDVAQKSRVDAARQVSDGLSSRLAALGAEVKQAETLVDDFRRQNGIVDANGRPINEQQLTDLTNQLVSARVRATELKSRLEQVQRLQRSGNVPDATSDTVLSSAMIQLRNRYAELAGQRDSLLTSLGPRHPSLQAVAAQLDGVRQLIAQEVARIAASVRNDYARAHETEESLGRQVAAATAATSTVNTATIRLRELERDAQARRAVYESFLNRSRETHEQGDLPNVNITVISDASVPLKRSGLPASLVAIVIALFGASAAALGLLALDHLRGRFATARQMSLATGLPLLASLPQGRAAVGGGRGGDAASTADDLALLDLVQALSEAAPGAQPRTVLLATWGRRATESALPLELARVLGEAGHRTLLVDAEGDRLTRPFAGTEAQSRDWGPVRRTPLPDLCVLAWSEPCLQPRPGKDDQAPLRQVSRDQDVVVVHAAASHSAPRLRRLAESSSNVVLVMDADAASVGALEQIRRDLGKAAGRVDGFVWVSGDLGQAVPAGGRPAGSARPASRPLSRARTTAA